MLSNKIKMLVGASIVLLGAIVGANAQIDNGSAIKIYVDHSFVVSGKTMPAGKYSISGISGDGTSDVLRLQSLDGKESMLFSTLQKIHNEPAKNTELVFDQVGDTYYLREIRTRGDEVGIQVAQSRSEKQTLESAGIE